METPDLKLMIDNSIYGYSDIKSLLTNLYNNNEDLSFVSGSLENSQAEFESKFGRTNLTADNWKRFMNLYSIEGGKVASPKKYKNKRYMDIIYFPTVKSSVPNRSDIIRFELAAGDATLFKALSNTSDESIQELFAGSLLEEDTVNNIESFFELYDNKSVLMKSKVADVNKWKNIESYDEFLQVPLLKEGKDFMNKFLNLEDRIEAGDSIEVEELENLIPSYMLDGGKVMGNLSLLDAVDPEYSDSSYILGEGASEITKELINRAFVTAFSVIRMTTLTDLKSTLAKINLLVRQIKKKSDILVDGGAASAASNKKKYTEVQMKKSKK